MIYYVNNSAPKNGNGTKEMPFKFINDAAKIAKAGDEVLVAPGIYHEYVDPVSGGTENARIVYKSEKPLGAKITSAETMNDWEHYKDNVWVCRVDNGVLAIITHTTMVGGDWYFAPVVRAIPARFI